MLFKKLAFALGLLFAVWSMTSCSKEEDVMLARVDENGNVYSPTIVGGDIEYLPTMKPEKVLIITVDESFNPVDTLDVDADSAYSGVTWGFNTGVRDFQYPYLKVVAVFSGEKNLKMEFPQYMRLGYYNDEMKLHLYGALISERVEALVRKDKYSLEDAKKKAYEELEKVLDVSLYDIEYREFKMQGRSWEPLGLYDLQLYVLCQHEISDSVFYSEFKTLRKQFAEKGGLNSSVRVRAADAWLSTFKTPAENSERNLFRSYSRDWTLGLGFLDTAFYSWAYVLNGSWKSSDSITIADERSAFYGKKFVYETMNGSSYYPGWRLTTPLEDSLGTCKYEWSDYIERDGNAYLCRYKSFVWETESSVDTVMKYKYSVCERNSSGYAVVGSYKDVLYACSCESADKCSWNKVDKDYKPDVWDTLSINIMATLRYGECKGHYKEKGELDTLLVLCSWNKWVAVDSVVYNLGECAKTNEDLFAQMPNGDYYKCRAYSGEWRPSTAIDAARIPCTYWENDRAYKEYDGKYYYCESEKWKEVTEDEYIGSH